MKKILLLLLAACGFSSCTTEEYVEPTPTKEKIVIIWDAQSQNIPLKGTVNVQIYSGSTKSEVNTTSNYISLDLVKGDYVTFMITPTPTDQAQNEAGILCHYIISDTKGIITQGSNFGTSFLVK